MKYTFTFCVRRVWIIIGYFLFQKQTLNRLLKVIGALNQLHSTFCAYLVCNKTLKARNSTPTHMNF